MLYYYFDHFQILCQIRMINLFMLSNRFYRQLALPTEAFDSKQRLLDALRKSFSVGTFSLGPYVTNSTVLEYWSFLKDAYIENVENGALAKRVCFRTSHLGLQNPSYWLLGPQV